MGELGSSARTVQGAVSPTHPNPCLIMSLKVFSSVWDQEGTLSAVTHGPRSRTSQSPSPSANSTAAAFLTLADT